MKAVWRPPWAARDTFVPLPDSGWGCTVGARLAERTGNIWMTELSAFR